MTSDEILAQYEAAGGVTKKAAAALKIGPRTLLRYVKLRGLGDEIARRWPDPRRARYVPMSCPRCGKRHVDEETAPLHLVHRCVDDPSGQGCGNRWSCDEYLYGAAPEGYGDTLVFTVELQVRVPMTTTVGQLAEALDAATTRIECCNGWRGVTFDAQTGATAAMQRVLSPEPKGVEPWPERLGLLGVIDSFNREARKQWLAAPGALPDPAAPTKGHRRKVPRKKAARSGSRSSALAATHRTSR